MPPILRKKLLYSYYYTVVIVVVARDAAVAKALRVVRARGGLLQAGQRPTGGAPSQAASCSLTYTMTMVISYLYYRQLANDWG